MKQRLTGPAALKFFLCGVLLAVPLTAASIQTTKPEDVGFSAERLNRIHDAVQRHIDGHDISGAVTLVARRGRVAHFDVQGLMDLDSKKPMAKDSIFRIWSMSKPVTGAAILMLMEEGKLRLNDPVPRFIPQFKNAKVAVAQERTPAAYPPPARPPPSRPPPARSAPAASLT